MAMFSHAQTARNVTFALPVWESEVSTLIDPATGLPSASTSMSFSDHWRTALEDEPVSFTLARYLSRCTIRAAARSSLASIN
jgi:hypothetical protein